MEELARALQVGLDDHLARRAVEEVQAQVRAWGLVLPAVQPLVLDFGLGELRKVGEVEFWIANEVEGGYCGKFLFVFSGQTCPTHHHRQKLETFFVVRGRVRMVCDGQEQVLQAGDVLRVQTGTDHSFTGIEPTLLLEVSRPSIIADNYFADPRIPIGGNYRRSGGGS